jgi:hypothetical protein
MTLTSSFQCSKTCGGGEQARHVQCVNQTSYEPVEGCDESHKPLTRQQCNTDKCNIQNAGMYCLHYSWTLFCVIWASCAYLGAVHYKL